MPATDLILYQFSRDRVEADDAKDFLSRFGKSSLPKGKKLEGMMNSVALMIDGYNHDPREIYAIPEVRAFYKQLWEVWPYWLYFCNLDSENLMMMVMCCLESACALRTLVWNDLVIFIFRRPPPQTSRLAPVYRVGSHSCARAFKRR